MSYNTELDLCVTALNITEGFGLFFVECDTPERYTELLEQIQNKCERNISTITLPESHPIYNIFPSLWVEEQVQYLPKDAIIFIRGFEHFLNLKNAYNVATEVAMHLNFARNAFQRLDRIFVFWLPKYAIDCIAKYGPDFFAYSTATFILE